MTFATLGCVDSSPQHSPPIQFQRAANGLAVISINRPHRRNALSFAAQEALAAAIQRAAADPPRLLIITGTGSAFAAGGDLKELAAHTSAEDGLRLNRTMGDALDLLTQLPCPVIGAVNGDAAGGGVELLTACDLRLAAPTARLQFAQVRMGLTTGWGGAGRLIFLLGQSRAAQLLLTGAALSAQEALAIGFVHQLCPPDEDPLTAALAWGETLLQLPPAALTGMKTLLWAGHREWLQTMTTLESQVFLSLYGQKDHLEALAAFQEKRPPRFT